MKQVAIIGASGFIGLRTTELLHAAAGYEPIPVVRSPKSLAVLARNQLNWRIANPLNVNALAYSLRGCECCVHVAIGDPFQIVEMAKTAYQACSKASVKRLVWMSSASVHGQNPASGTSEVSRIRSNHPLAYNNAKVKAEQILERLQSDGKVEVVRLRPGVVYGPRSRWVYNIATALHREEALWLDDGKGILNGIYVDNLAHAIQLAIDVPEARNQAFLLGDDETCTWQDLMLPIAQHLGYDTTAFNPAELVPIQAECISWKDWLVTRRWYGPIGARIPGKWKNAIKRLNAKEVSPSSNHKKPAQLSPELQLLQQCSSKFSHAKARDLLGYSPPVPFVRGIEHSLQWLDFIDFPKR